MSERSGGRERSEQSGASERVSGASERANGRANGPVLTSVFLSIFDHGAIRLLDGPSNVNVFSGRTRDTSERHQRLAVQVQSTVKEILIQFKEVSKHYGSEQPDAGS